MKRSVSFLALLFFGLLVFLPSPVLAVGNCTTTDVEQYLLSSFTVAPNYVLPGSTVKLTTTLKNNSPTTSPCTMPATTRYLRVVVDNGAFENFYILSRNTLASQQSRIESSQQFVIAPTAVSSHNIKVRVSAWTRGYRYYQWSTGPLSAGQTFNVTCATSTEHCAAFVSQTNPSPIQRLSGVPFSVVMKNWGSVPWDGTYALAPAAAFSPSPPILPPPPPPPLPIHTIAVDGKVGTNPIRFGRSYPVQSFPVRLIRNKPAFAIDFWVKNGWETILGDTSGALQGNFHLALKTLEDRRGRRNVHYDYQFPRGDSNDYSLSGTQSALDLNDDRWHHVVISFKQGDAFKLLVDGQLYSAPRSSAQEPFTIRGDSVTLGRTIVGQMAGPWWRRRLTERVDYGSGEIDEFKIYDQTLSDETPSATAFDTVLAKSSGTTSYSQTATFTGTLQAPAWRGKHTITWRLIKRGGTPSITPNPAASTDVTLLPGDVSRTIRVTASGFERASDVVYPGDNVAISFVGSADAVGNIIRSSRSPSQKITIANETKQFPATGTYADIASSIRFSLGTVNLATNPTTGVSTPLYEVRVCQKSAAGCP